MSVIVLYLIHTLIVSLHCSLRIGDQILDQSRHNFIFHDSWHSSASASYNFACNHNTYTLLSRKLKFEWIIPSWQIWNLWQNWRYSELTTYAIWKLYIGKQLRQFRVSTWSAFNKMPEKLNPHLHSTSNLDSNSSSVNQCYSFS